MSLRLGVLASLREIKEAAMTDNANRKELVDAAFRIHTTLGPGRRPVNRLALLLNFNVARDIKDGIARIVNGLEEEPRAKPQSRQENT